MNLDISKLAKELKNELTSVELIGEEALDKMLNEDLVNPDADYEKPIPLIQMVGDNDKIYDVLTTQNISMTIGAGKSKKTFYSTMMAAALLGFKKHGIIGLTRGLKTIFFDTEQSKYHVQRLNNRIKKMVGKLFGFELYCLRRRSPTERRAEIEHYLLKNNGKYSFVFIDGIVDLIHNFNDVEECTDIVTDLMRWSDVYDCHINNVLHITQGFGNAKGHLGSLLTNKGECIFRVTKEDDNTSRVTCESSRNEAFPAFSFRIDEQGLPIRDIMPERFYNNEPLPEIINNSEGLNPNHAPF